MEGRGLGTSSPADQVVTFLLSSFSPPEWREVMMMRVVMMMGMVNPTTATALAIMVVELRTVRVVVMGARSLCENGGDNDGCGSAGRGLVWSGRGEGYCSLVVAKRPTHTPHVPEGRICSGMSTCRHTEIEAAAQSCCLTQSQDSDTRLTCPSSDSTRPDAWQVSH